MRKSFTRKMLTLLAAPALALAVLAAPVAQAAQHAPKIPAAATHYWIVDNGGAPGGYYMNNPGVNNAVKTSGASTFYTFTNETTWNGHNVYLMRINGGSDCLDWFTVGGPVYDKPCVPGSVNNLWWHDGNFLVNAGASNFYVTNAWAYASDIGNGATVDIGCCTTQNPANNWATPVA